MAEEFMTNIYNPEKPDAIDHLIHNQDPNKKEFLFKYYLDQIKLTKIGDPRENGRHSVEELKEMGMVGLYKTKDTPKSVVNFFGVSPEKAGKKYLYEPEHTLLGEEEISSRQTPNEDDLFA